HMAGPGSSETHQQARLRKVCVLEDCAEHLMAMSLTRLSATTSIASLTQGELSERQRPGMGEVLSTTMCDSHHCQGVRRSAGRVAALNPLSSGVIPGRQRSCQLASSQWIR